MRSQHVTALLAIEQSLEEEESLRLPRAEEGVGFLLGLGAVEGFSIYDGRAVNRDPLLVCFAVVVGGVDDAVDRVSCPSVLASPFSGDARSVEAEDYFIHVHVLEVPFEYQLD